MPDLNKGDRTRGAVTPVGLEGIATAGTLAAEIPCTRFRGFSSGLCDALQAPPRGLSENSATHVPRATPRATPRGLCRARAERELRDVFAARPIAPGFSAPFALAPTF